MAANERLITWTYSLRIGESSANKYRRIRSKLACEHPVDCTTFIQLYVIERVAYVFFPRKMLRYYFARY